MYARPLAASNKLRHKQGRARAPQAGTAAWACNLVIAARAVGRAVRAGGDEVGVGTGTRVATSREEYKEARAGGARGGGDGGRGRGKASEDTEESGQGTRRKSVQGRGGDEERHDEEGTTAQPDAREGHVSHVEPFRIRVD